jgi:hypothetical protein
MCRDAFDYFGDTTDEENRRAGNNEALDNDIPTTKPFHAFEKRSTLRIQLSHHFNSSFYLRAIQQPRIKGLQ